MKITEAQKILNENGYELLKEDVYETGISDEEYAAAYNFLYDNKLKNIQNVLKTLCKFVNKNCNIPIDDDNIIGFACKYDTFDKDKNTSFDVFNLYFTYTPKLFGFYKKEKKIVDSLELTIECDEITKYKIMVRNERQREHYYYTDYKKFLNYLKWAILKFEDDNYFKLGEKQARKLPKNIFSLSKFIDEIFYLFKVKD